MTQAHATPLTDKQERFIYEYLLDQNASAAVRRAGYSGRSAGAQAAELMHHPQVRARIRAELAQMFAELRVTAVRLLRQRTRVAFFDPGKLFDAEGKPLALKDLDPDTRAALVIHYDINPKGGITTRVRSPNCNAALTALEKGYARMMDLSQWEPLQEVAEEEYVSMAEPEAAALAEPEVAEPEVAAQPAAPVHAATPATTFSQRIAQWVAGPSAVPAASNDAGGAAALPAGRTAARGEAKQPALA